jgi:hypothetical protein
MRIRSIKRILPLIILIAVVSLSLTGLPLLAEEEREGIGISPTKLTLDADPGEQISGQFIVTNPGTKPVDYRLYVKDFSIRNEEYEKDFEPIPGAVSPVDWIQVPDGVKNLAPGVQEELPYTITVPTDTVPRGYYAVIFAETVTPEADATGVARLKRVGLLVYLTVNGGSVEKGKVVSFETKGWQSKRPVKTALRIQNEGNVHFATEGTIYLKDILGRTAAKTEISGTVLPATIRKFSPELKLNQPFGLYKIGGDVTFLGKKVPLAEKWIFVGSPFWLVLFVVIIVGWAFVLIRWVKRRVKRNKKR